MMMKRVAVLFTAVIMVQCQRPPYAGSSKPYPSVLPQYLEEQAAAAAAAANSTGGVLNRIDTSNGTNVISLSASPEASNASVASTIPPDIPIDALGDIDLINRIKTWPREKQPFWFINWQQIQKHRGDSNNRAQPAETQPNSRSFFAG
ncbi:uncharacterized protein LOC117600426 [Osmia lignaria lignaria]|uniref:uncharacterized protein LOC117600426 n=1 Tax=Osmia lignaria lignaria TaxID=1437193 RepID=UPI001478B716|nr:uncharacterized protein LOC117600426 [Osmia lignaria]